MSGRSPSLGAEKPPAKGLSRRLAVLKATAPIVILLTVVTAGLGYLWVKTRPVMYEADSTVILLVPLRTSENPYGYFPRSVITTAQAVVDRVDQASTRDEIKREGGLDDYEVTVTNYGNQWVPIYSEPTIQVSGRSSDSDALARTQSLVIARMRAELLDLQESVDVTATHLISLQPVVAGFPVPLHGRPSRAVAAVFALALWISVLIGRFIRRRIVRPRPASSASGGPTTVVAQSSPAQVAGDGKEAELVGARSPGHPVRG